MTVRRVVTGHDDEGRSVLLEDSEIPPEAVDGFPGFEPHGVWAIDGPAGLPTGSPPEAPTWFPPVDGVRFQVITMPAGAFRDRQPDDPAMHVTDTVDHVYVASGEVVLELGDGTEVEVHAGDTVVQQGTWHAWRNRGTVPCVIVGVLVGARRS